MSIPPELDDYVRRSLLWIESQQSIAARSGLPLSRRETSIARQAGVRGPERVRLLPVPEMPTPEDAVLQQAMRATGFWLGGAQGLTLGHSILLLRPSLSPSLSPSPSTHGAVDSGSDSEHGWRSESLVAHELVHVAQVERLGLGAFLSLYFEQCLSVGYGASPLELEARAFRPDLARLP